MPQKPLLLSDNLFEATALHPSFVIGNLQTDDASGRELFHVSDNLRDMTSWTPSASNSARNLYVDSGSGNSISANMVVLDRGHNLAGKAVNFGSYTDATLATPVTVNSYTIPATAGGLPTDTNGCLAADGTWWKTFTAVTGRALAFTVQAMGAGLSPIVTGLYAGMSYRFPEYVNAPFADDYDTDIQIQTNRMSRGGLRVMTRKLNFRKLAVNIDMESTDYPAFDVQARPLLRYGQPWWVCFDDSDATHAGMIAPFQLSGNVRYQPQANPVHREIRGFDLEELLPRLWT